MALATKFSGGWACPAVASVGLVSLLFFPEKKLTTFFLVSHRRLQSDDPFSAVRPRLSTVLSKFSHIFYFIRVSPPGGCHPERSAPTPPSDATGARPYNYSVPPQRQTILHVAQLQSRLSLYNTCLNW